LPDSEVVKEQDQPKRGGVENSKHETLVNKKKCGPILVEKRPSRYQLDGKTIMEKAQERKKKTNLDGCKGNSKSYNPFYIPSNSDISSLAEVTSVSLGNNDRGVNSMLAEMQEDDNLRARYFSDSCTVCQVENGEPSVVLEVSSFKCEEGDAAPVTPQAPVIKPQLEGSDGLLGQCVTIRVMKFLILIIRLLIKHEILWLIKS
jgi:hypothetical protein